MADDKENPRRVIRVRESMMRAASALLLRPNNQEPHTPPVAKEKRVVLGDISSNILRNQNENLAGSSDQPPVKKAKKGNVAAVARKKTPVVGFPVESTKMTGIDVQGEEDKGPQICAAYAAGSSDQPPVRKAKKGNAAAVARKKTPVAGFPVESTKMTGIDVQGEEDKGPQICAAYASGIYEYLRGMEKESDRRPLPDYIEKIQSNKISANMRGILVDWLAEVTDEYNLQSDSLFLTVSYIDRYLSMYPISRQQLQLLGVSAMLAATKFEEINPPQVHELIFMTDNTYTMEEVLKMESDLLNFLKYDMGYPTVKTFLRRFIRFVQDTRSLEEKHLLKFEFLGYYLAELSLLDYGCCVKFLPSMIAAAVIFLAKFTLNPNKRPWDDMGLQLYSGYKASDLMECALIIHDMQLRKGGVWVAIRDRYKLLKFKCVCTLSSPVVIPASYFEDVE